MITLSVVLPVRDGAPYLADALTSLTARSGTSPTRDVGGEAGVVEVIVVDDGSVDATPEIIEDFRHDLPGLAIVRNPVPVGLADARNLGLKLASGRFVTFLDGDDWVARGYLGQLVAAIDGLGCDFVRVDHVQVEGRRRETHRAPEPRRNVVLDPRDAILPSAAKTMVDYPYAWAGIYRRDLGDLLAFPQGLHTAEDRPWIWRLHQEARSFAVVSLAGLFYRRGVPTSLTQIGDERQLHFFDAYDLILDEVEPRFLPKAARNLCALLAHHVEQADRFEPDLWTRFGDRAAGVLGRLPREVLDEAVSSLEPERRLLLEPLVPGGTGV